MRGNRLYRRGKCRNVNPRQTQPGAHWCALRVLAIHACLRSRTRAGDSHTKPAGALHHRRTFNVCIADRWVGRPEVMGAKFGGAKTDPHGAVRVFLGLRLPQSTGSCADVEPFLTFLTCIRATRGRAIDTDHDIEAAEAVLFRTSRLSSRCFGHPPPSGSAWLHCYPEDLTSQEKRRYSPSETSAPQIGD